MQLLNFGELQRLSLRTLPACCHASRLLRHAAAQPPQAYETRYCPRTLVGHAFSDRVHCDIKCICCCSSYNEWRRDPGTEDPSTQYCYGNLGYYISSGRWCVYLRCLTVLWRVSTATIREHSTSGQHTQPPSRTTTSSVSERSTQDLCCIVIDFCICWAEAGPERRRHGSPGQHAAAVLLQSLPRSVHFPAPSGGSHAVF